MKIRVRPAFAGVPVLLLMAACALPADTPAKPTRPAAKVIRLHARDAEIQGSDAEYESRPDRGCVGLWKSSDLVVRWRFELEVPGEYFVDVCQSWDSKKDTPPSRQGKGAAGEYTVKVAAQSCTAKVADTGDWGRFRIVRVGKVKLAMRGRYAVVVTGRLGEGRHLMNLRSLRLVPVVAGAGGLICLGADHAEIQGTGAVYEPRAGRDCVGQWKQADVVVRWQFEVPAPGEYFVDVTQSCDGTMAGGEMTVKVGGQSLTAQVLDTGDWAQFRTVRAGKVKFAKPGAHALAVSGRPKADMFLMNLRGVRLVATDKLVAAPPTAKPPAPPATSKPAEPFDAARFAALVQHTLDGAKTDAERAVRLYHAAQDAEDRPALQVRLLAEAVNYALRSPAAASARDAAARALHLLDERAPDRKRQWLLKRVQLHRGWYRNTTKRDEKRPAGGSSSISFWSWPALSGKRGSGQRRPISFARPSSSPAVSSFPTKRRSRRRISMPATWRGLAGGSPATSGFSIKSLRKPGFEPP